MSVVGTIGAGEAFVRMDQDGGRYAINGTSSSWNVQSDPNIFEADGVAYTQVAFLHTSFPTYGYIGTDGIVDVYTKYFSTVVADKTYYVLETQETLECNITTELGTLTSMPSGSQIAVLQADVYGSPQQMTFYGYKNSDPTISDNQWMWSGSPMNPSSYPAWIDTGIESGSGCPYWGIKLNRTCP